MTVSAEDLVVATSMSAGSGDLVLAGPSAPVRFMPSAAMDGEKFWWRIEHQTLDEVEVVYAAYQHSTTSILRAAATDADVSQSTNAGNKVIFSGGGLICSLVPAAAVFSHSLPADVLLATDADQALTSPTGPSIVHFNQNIVLTAQREVLIHQEAKGPNARIFVVTNQASGGFGVLLRRENPTDPGIFDDVLDPNVNPVVLGQDQTAVLMLRNEGWDELIYTGPVLGGPADNPVVSVTGTTYTIGLDDRVIEAENAAAQTITVPLNATTAIPVGRQIWIMRKGDGNVDLAPEGAVVIRTNGGLTVTEVNGTGLLKKVGTDEWVFNSFAPFRITTTVSSLPETIETGDANTARTYTVAGTVNLSDTARLPSNSEVWLRNASGGVVTVTRLGATITFNGATSFELVGTARIKREGALTDYRVINALGASVAEMVEEPSPAAGDFLKGWDSAGVPRKFDVGDLPAGSGGGFSSVSVTANRALAAGDVDKTLVGAKTTAGNLELILPSGVIGADTSKIEIANAQADAKLVEVIHDVGDITPVRFLVDKDIQATLADGVSIDRGQAVSLFREPGNDDIIIAVGKVGIVIVAGAPVAVNDSPANLEEFDGDVDIDVLANDTYDGTPTIVIDSQSGPGTATVVGTGAASRIRIPTDDGAGTYSITYSLTATGNVGSDTAVLAVTVDVWTPANLTGVTTWLDANAEALGTLTTWNDQIGTNDFTASTSPAEQPSVIDAGGGVKLVNFTGGGAETAGNGDRSTGPTWTTLTSPTPLSTWFVALVYNIDLINAVSGEALSAEGDMLLTDNVRNITINVDPISGIVLTHWDGIATLATIANAGAGGTGTRRLVHAWQAGTGAGALALKINDGAPQTAAANALASNTTGPVNVGGGNTSFPPWNWFDGQLGAVVLCSAKPSDAQLTKLYKWSQARYSVP